jgi:hypothetical protein
MNVKETVAEIKRKENSKKKLRRKEKEWEKETWRKKAQIRDII